MGATRTGTPPVDRRALCNRGGAYLLQPLCATAPHGASIQKRRWILRVRSFGSAVQVAANVEASSRSSRSSLKRAPSGAESDGGHHGRALAPIELSRQTRPRHARAKGKPGPASRKLAQVRTLRLEDIHRMADGFLVGVVDALDEQPSFRELNHGGKTSEAE